MENLMIGAAGWDQAGWLGDFYPNDMPEDWRLDYYSQFFQTVLISEKAWQGWNGEKMEAMAEALAGEVFYFVFEVVDSLSDQAVERLALLKSQLGSQAYGLLCYGEAPLVEGFCVTYVSHDSWPDSVAGWRWQSEDVFLWGEPLGYVSSLPEDGKDQAELLKKFMASLPKEQLGALFLVGASELNISQLKNLKVIAELLGF